MRNLSMHWQGSADLNALIAMPVREKIGRFKYTKDADIEGEYEECRRRTGQGSSRHSGRRTSKLCQKNIEPYRKLRTSLMLVRGVENVAYDELGEIRACKRREAPCKVLEINGSECLVQLFESATGINLSNSKVRFLGRSMELGVSEDAWTCI